MWRAIVVVALVSFVGCKDKSTPPPTVPIPSDAAVVDAAPAPADWKPRCKAALIAAAKEPIARRPREIIDGCKPCGDWTPLLRWDIPGADGGPTRDAIEEAMERCEAYCTPASKQKFLGALDDARGKNVRTPWRSLGDACGEAVSAKPDTRFASAPYFALDRIARAAAADPEMAKLLAAIELPLPAVSISGDGLVVPMAPVTTPDTGRVQVTVSDKQQHVGLMPRARLVGTGVFVELGAEPYPGAIVDGKQLAAAISKVAGTDSMAITLIAPTGLPARRIADVVLHGGKSSFVLAAEIRAAPHGWSLLGHVPVAMVAPPDGDMPVSMALTIDTAKSVDVAVEKIKQAKAPQLGGPALTIGKGDATTADLAKLLGALAYRDVKQLFVMVQ